MSKVHVFVSYSHEDKRWFEEKDFDRLPLVLWLDRMLKPHGVKLWYDRKGLGAGDRFREDIEHQIDRADIALLLVSPEFMVSDFITKVELPRIRRRLNDGELCVMPLITTPCSYEELGLESSVLHLPDEQKTLIDYTDSEKEYVNVRADILKSIRRQVDTVRNRRVAEAQTEKPQEQKTEDEVETEPIAEEEAPSDRVREEEEVQLEGAAKMAEMPSVADDTERTWLRAQWETHASRLPAWAWVTLGCVLVAMVIVALWRPQSVDHGVTDFARGQPDLYVGQDTHDDSPREQADITSTDSDSAELRVDSDTAMSHLGNEGPAFQEGMTPSKIGWGPDDQAYPDRFVVYPQDGSELVWVPAGEFMRGSADEDEDAEDNEKPQRVVRITHGFWIGKHPVTNVQYAEFCEQDSWRKVHFRSDQGDDHPAVWIRWAVAKTYCKRYDLGLPTEAQWEYAARGPEGHTYPWGNQWDPNRLCWDENRGPDEKTFPVGSFTDGASWCGALDMAGNVWEWTADWYQEDYYESAPHDNPPGPSEGQATKVVYLHGSYPNHTVLDGAVGVMRGGSYASEKLSNRSAFRLARSGLHAPDSPRMLSGTYVRIEDVGFRVIKTP